MSVRTKLLVGAAAIGLLSAGQAQAFGESPYFAILGGLNFLGDIEVTSENDWPVDDYMRTFGYDTGFAGAIAVGHRFSPNFRAEGELSFRTNSLGSVTVQFEGPQAFDGGHTKTFGIMANGWFDIPTGGKATPYVGGGVGFAHVKINADTEMGAPCTRCYGLDFEGSGWAPAFQLGAGVAVDGAGGTWTFDYRVFGTGGIDVPWTNGGGGDGMSSSTLSHSAMVGFRAPIGQ